VQNEISHYEETNATELEDLRPFETAISTERKREREREKERESIRKRLIK